MSLLLFFASPRRSRAVFCSRAVPVAVHLY